MQRLWIFRIITNESAQIYFFPKIIIVKNIKIILAFFIALCVISSCRKDNIITDIEKMPSIPLILTLCRRDASQNVEAQDFMQECFIQVFSKIRTYDPNKGAFEGWLYRVSTNCVLQILRKNKREITMVFPEILPEQEMTASEFETISREAIMNAIQRLPNGYREVLNLYMFEGWTHKEIGKALEIAETTSRSQLTRAKKMLKHILQKKIKVRYERKLA